MPSMGWFLGCVVISAICLQSSWAIHVGGVTAGKPTALGSQPPTYSALQLRKPEALRGGAAPAVTHDNIFVSAWKKYEDALDSEPFKTRMLSGFVISSIGDVICQYVSAQGKLKALNLKQLLIFASWGAFGFTPIGFWWYGFMESAVPKDIPFRGIVKVILDQSLFSTTMTAITFIILTIIEGWFSGIDFLFGKLPSLNGASIPPLGRLLEKGKDKLNNELWPTLIENWKVWPAAQILNFTVVPFKFQTLFVNIVAIWWNFILSRRQHK